MSWEDWVLSRIRRIARRSILSRSAADGYEQMEGYSTDPGEPEALDRVRRVQHYGFRSRPGPGAELWAIAPEVGTSQRVYVASEVKGEGPQDQAEWDVEVYAKDGATVRVRANGATILVDANGKISIDAKAGQEVNIQGGVNGIARELDPVDAVNAMIVWMAAVNTALTTLAGATGLVVPTVTAPGPAPATFGFIKQGSSKAKCG